VVRQHVVAMIRPERDRVIGASHIAASRLFIQQHSDQRHHVRVACQVCGLFKRSVRVFGDVAQMREMDAVCDTCRYGWHIVDRIGPKRSGTQRDPVCRAVMSGQYPFQIITV